MTDNNNMTEPINNELTDAEKKREYHRQYRLNNKEKIKEIKKSFALRKKENAEIIKQEKLNEKLINVYDDEKPFDKLEYRRRYYEANKERLKEEQRLKYNSNDTFKEHKKELMRINNKKIYDDPVKKAILCEKIKEHYKNDEEYRNKTIERSINKYHKDDLYREKYLQQKRFNNMMSKITS